MSSPSRSTRSPATTHVAGLLAILMALASAVTSEAVASPRARETGATRAQPPGTLPPSESPVVSTGYGQIVRQDMVDAALAQLPTDVRQKLVENADERIIDFLRVQGLLYDEALRRHLDESPRLVLPLVLSARRVLAQAQLNAEVHRRVTDAVLQTWYQEHLATRPYDEVEAQVRAGAEREASQAYVDGLLSSDRPKKGAPRGVPGALPPSSSAVVRSEHGQTIRQDMLDAQLDTLPSALRAQLGERAADRVTDELVVQGVLYDEAIRQRRHEDRGMDLQLALGQRQVLDMALLEEVAQERLTDALARQWYEDHRLQFSDQGGAVRPYDEVAAAVRDQLRQELGRRYVEELEQAATIPDAATPPVIAVAIPVTLPSTAPITGDPAAPITVVEFEDFECPFCSRSAFTLHELPTSHPNVRVVFLHYPLDRACNPVVHSDFHRNACAAAVAAECARRQDRFWELARGLFNNQEHLDPDGLAILEAEAGLSAEAMASCTQGGEAMETVQGDVRLGAALDVDGTPTILIHGIYGDDWVSVDGHVDEVEALLLLSEAGQPLPTPAAAEP